LKEGDNMKIKITAIMLSVLLILFYFTGCSQTAYETSEGSGNNELLISENTSGSDTTKIALNGSSASISGIGASAVGSVVTITEKGTYVISGTLTDGQIAIAATNTDEVRLVLDGVDITNKTGAPIYASQCEKLIVTLAEGTQNILTDGGSDFQYVNTTDEEPNAALFSKDDMDINGTGSLTVNAGFNNGIGSKDNLVIISGNITVNAVNHGLRGNDSLTITDGILNITAGNDGIQTKNDIVIDGGTFNIASADDGIHADGILTINGGTINVTESYEALEASSIVITGGVMDLVSSDDAINAAGGADQSGAGGTFGKDSFASAGMYSIDISGGSITLFAGGDGIDSNGTINVSGGTIISMIKSTNDNGAIDADGEVTFTGGTIIYGGTGMGSAPGRNSAQSYVFVNSGITAGEEITVKKDGKVLIAFTPAINGTYLALSSPDIISGESYEIYSGESLISTITAGTGGGQGGFGGGRGGGMGMPGGTFERDANGRPDGMKMPNGMGDPGGMTAPEGQDQLPK